MSARDRRDDDLEDRLDELEDVLSDLRRDLRETERDRAGPPGAPRPPRLSELVRFTEQYTIPTIIALLETTITSLELLRGTLRLADPDRSVTEGAASTGDRLATVRDGASAGLSRSLAELRTALSEANLPEDAASRSIVADARDLTAEIESRIDESRRAADAEPASPSDGTRHGDDAESDTGGAVEIDVTDPDAESEDVAGRDTAEGASPEVDVESELESIKRRIDDENTDEAGDDEGTDKASGEDDTGDGHGSETDRGDTGEDESGTD